MAYRHVLSLILILAFIWSEEVLSFSSTSRGTMTRPTASTKNQNSITATTLSLVLEKKFGIQATISTRQSPAHEHCTTSTSSTTQLTMSSDDSSSEKEALKEKEDGDKASTTQKSNVILVFPLFCKFLVVLMIKFLTDLVVYPSLLLFRLAKKTKRKIVATFDRISFGSTASSFKPNGSGRARWKQKNYRIGYPHAAVRLDFMWVSGEIDFSLPLTPWCYSPGVGFQRQTKLPNFWIRNPILYFSYDHYYSLTNPIPNRSLIDRFLIYTF